MMKTVMLTFVFIFSTSIFAQEMGPINADIRCEQPGGGLAFKMPNNMYRARIWQTDKGQPNGLELEVTQLKTGQCDGCFTFKGVLMNQLQVKGSVLNFVLQKYEVLDPETKKWQLALKNIKCVDAN